MEKVKLTSEERNLAERNHNLIYTYAEKHNMCCEDVYDLLAIGLCKAAAKFDSSKASFSTIAYMQMDSEILGWKRCRLKKSNIPKKLITSENDSGESTIKGRNIYRNSNIKKHNGPEYSVIDKISYNEFIETLARDEKQVLKLLLRGNTQQEIAHRLQITQGMVSVIKKRLGNKYNFFYNNH